VGLLVAGMALAPAARGQHDVAPADTAGHPLCGALPLPLYHSRPETGGVYTFAEFVLFRQTNPLEHQPLAFRGFVDVDGSITGRVGAFVGSHATALDAYQASGPNTYAPGCNVGLGYRFQDGSAIHVSWMWLATQTFTANASLAPRNLQIGPQGADSYLFSPVFNFPSDYAGPRVDTGAGQDGSTFGIWNAADNMTLEFEQRASQIEVVYRQPVYEDDCFRCYGLVGPRFFWIWERFKWRTVDLDATGNATPFDVGIYTNIVSNRMYGAFVGMGNEWYLGHGFALSLDLRATLFLDIVKERAKYELGEKFAGPAIKRGITDFTVVPEIDAQLNLWWYPTEGIQLRVGYTGMAFFNTVAAKTPVSFNYGGVDPPWTKQAVRLFDGLNLGIGFIF
jgi:hypothetical protein